LLPIAPLPGMSDETWAKTLTVALWTMRRLRLNRRVMKSVAGKIVLVTGAAMGLGKLFARTAVDEGAAAVVLWDINESALKDTAAELEAEGGTVHTYVVDVSSAAAVTKAATQVRAEVGDVQILVNNAGIVRAMATSGEQAPRRRADDADQLPGPMFVAHEFCRRWSSRTTSAASSTWRRRPAERVPAWPLRRLEVAAVGCRLGAPRARAGRPQARPRHHGLPTYINTGMFDGAKGIFLTRCSSRKRSSPARGRRCSRAARS